MKTLSYIWNVLIMAMLFMHLLRFKKWLFAADKKDIWKESDSVNPARVNLSQDTTSILLQLSKKEKNQQFYCFDY